MATWTDVVVRYRNIKTPTHPTNLRQVTIATENFQENVTKMLTPITPPQSSANYSSGKSDTLTVDLLRIEERYTVTGRLATAHGSSGSYDVGDGGGSQTYTEQSNASDKRDDLRSIIKAGGTFWISFQGTNFKVNCDKLQIDLDNMDAAEPGSGETGYKVMMTLILCKNVGDA